MANESAHTPGGSLEDKLRLAASKGQVERIPELLTKGATFSPDRVRKTGSTRSGLWDEVELLFLLLFFLGGANCHSFRSFKWICWSGHNARSKRMWRQRRRQRKWIERTLTCYCVHSTLKLVFCFRPFQLGYTALHRAAAQGHLEVIRSLCERACNLDAQDQVVRTKPNPKQYFKSTSVLLKCILPCFVIAWQHCTSRSSLEWIQQDSGSSDTIQSQCGACQQGTFAPRDIIPHPRFPCGVSKSTTSSWRRALRRDECLAVVTELCYCCHESCSAFQVFIRQLILPIQTPHSVFSLPFLKIV